jgi:hypothetical protein
MRRLALALAPLLLTLGTPALAQASSWRVSEVSGNVQVTEAGRSRPATRGTLLSSGSMIATAARARAVLVRGEDYVVVSPNSRLRVPDAAQAASRGVIQMLTDWGTALFRIEHRATPHFGVQTPYLAAVVKGTVFTVTVGQSGASVQVTEGAVEVSTVDGGAAELVRPGMVAMVAASDLLQLNIEAETSRSIRSNGAPAAGVVTVPAPDAGRYEGPADPTAAVSTPVTEGDVSLGDVTDGLVAGRGGADLAVVDLDVNHDRGSGNSDPGESDNGGASPAPGPGDGNNGGGNDSGGNDSSNPGNGGHDNPGAGGDNDDGNNGGGNDDDGDDASNPGHGGSGDNSGPGSGDDDGNNGGGNDDDGDDASNPGHGGSGDNSGPGGGDDDGNNGGGNDDDGDDASNPGHGGSGDNSGPGGGDDDGNNGGGNDEDDDDSGPGNGRGGDGHGPPRD